MLMWMLGNLNPHKFLVSKYNSSDSLKNSLEVPQDVKHRVTICPSNFTPRYIPKRIENICSERNLSRNEMFITALVKKWKLPKYPSVDGYTIVVCPFNGILFSHKWNTNTLYNINEPWKHHSEWKKPDTKHNTRVVSLKWNVQNGQIHGDRK